MTPATPTGPGPNKPRPTPPRPPTSGKRPAVRVPVAKPKAASTALPLVVTISALLLAGGALAIRRVQTAVDPHYTHAREMVSKYETGLPENQRDYTSRLYKDALAELDQVNPKSASAQAADEMKKELLARIDAFGKRMAAQEEQQRQNEQNHADRIAAVFSVAKQASEIEERRRSTGDEAVCAEPDGTLHREGPEADKENDKPPGTPPAAPAPHHHDHDD